MEVQIDPMLKQELDDVFDAFSILAGGNYVSLLHVKAGITRYSPGSVELFQLPGEYIPDGAMDWLEYIHPEDRERYLGVMMPLIQGETQTYDLIYRVRTKTGKYVSCRFTGAVLRDAQGKPGLIGGMTVNQALMENTDPITVLRNKFGFFEDLDGLLRENRRAIALLVGISKLSEINKVHGYSFGNRVLQAMAETVQEAVQDRGAVYRMDDATFAILSQGLTRADAAALYEGFRAKLQQGLGIDSETIPLSVNGGLISTYGLHMDARTVYSCLKYAYDESRHRVHGALVDFNGNVNYEVRESVEMINVIRDSIIEGCRGFSLDYQPVISASTEKLLGVEALVRWEGSPYGSVEPLRFLPVLEKDFVFEELGSWIIHQALTDGIRFLEKDPDFILSLNISVIQLEDEYFIDSLKEPLRATGFPARNLCLEVTKGCRLLEVSRLREIVQSVHALGIRVIIDDFGTGFESIAFLKQLSADYIKFDRSLVEEIETNRADRQTMDYMAHLASLRGVQVIAKGVETQGMRDILKTCSVNGMQGDFYSKPLSFDEMMKTFFSE